MNRKQKRTADRRDADRNRDEAADAAGGLLALGGISDRHDHVRACLGKAAGDDEPDPVARAGEDGELSGKIRDDWLRSQSPVHERSQMTMSVLRARRGLLRFAADQPQPACESVLEPFRLRIQGCLTRGSPVPLSGARRPAGPQARRTSKAPGPCRLPATDLIRM
jgi:hypothetical protein